MTEAEWLACTDPQRMLEYLRGKASDRKLRLFACACCQFVRPLMTDERSRRAVEGGERYADGLASQLELEVVRAEARAAIPSKNRSRGLTVGTRAWREARVVHALTRAAFAAACNPPDARSTAQQTARVAEQRGLAWNGGVGNWQSNLLRCIFSNPCCPTVVDPLWFTWHDATLPMLAQAVYDERAFDRLPILADALEDAGCHDAGILAHCRGPGPHVRGCWVVDLLLGKT
jgi:hypothetical protein